MATFKRSASSLPVTALCFVDGFLLAGEGGTVNVYDVPTCSWLASRVVLVGATVHGITLCQDASDTVAVHGGKQMKVISCKLHECKLQEQSSMIRLPDWIWAVCWLYKDAYLHDTPRLPRYMAAALGHNTVALVDWSNTGVVSMVHCQDKCILYSAHFVGSAWNNLILAAGTVFNQVVLWAASQSGSTLQPCDKLNQSESSLQPCGQINQSESRSQSRDQHKDTDRVKVMHRLCGHQGVIFHITTDVAQCRLCSVSDDRSVRLWRVVSNSTLPLTDWSVDCWQAAKFELLHVLYGHTARVWQAVLLKTRLISVGEDATCVSWTYDGQISDRVRGHRGRSIWSVACSQDELMVATGGGDNSIRISPLSTGGGADNSWNSRHIGPDLKEDDFPKTVNLLGTNTIIMMSSKGLLQSYDIQFGIWTTIMTDPDFSSYSILATISKHKLVAVGNIQGTVKIYTLAGQVLTKTQVFEGKIHSFIVVGVTSLTTQLLASGPGGQVSMFELVVPPTDPSVHEVCRLSLPKTKQWWVSAVCRPSVHLLVCGDRGGSVHVYKIDSRHMRDSHSTPDLLPVQSFPRIHGKAGVTDVCYHDNQVFTCGRDGHYRVYRVGEESLTLLQACKPCKGWEWLARLVHHHGNLYVCGFHSDQFVVQDVRQSHRLLGVPCGGGHRDWDFVVGDSSSHGNRAQFVYIKHRGVVICQGSLGTNARVVKPPIHGGQINDVLCLHGNTADERTVLVTAGEDGLVNILSTDCQRISVVGRLQGHISSVRCLAASPSCLSDHGHDSTILFSGGGRAQLLVWRVWWQGERTGQGADADDAGWQEQRGERTGQRTDGDDAGWQEQRGEGAGQAADGDDAGWQEQLSQHTVVEDGGVRRSKTWRTRAVVADPETRVMSLDACRLSDLDPDLPQTAHVASSGGSDGSLRVFLYDEMTRSLELLIQSDFHQHCILCTKHITLETSNRRRTVIISTATDGTVAFWDISDVLAVSSAERSSQCEAGRRSPVVGCPAWHRRVHQSGINSLDIRPLSDSQYLLATGGDDSSISLLTLQVTFDLKLEVKVTASVDKKDAHSAQVTGVSILDETTILSISIDQRLVCWTVDHSNQRLIQVACTFVDVADVSNFAVWRSRDGDTRTAVCGVGLETYSLSHKLQQS